MSRSKTSTIQGKTGAKVRAHLRTTAKQARGTVRFYDGSKLLAKVRVKDTNRNGITTVSYRLPRSLAAGKHVITAKFTPSKSSSASSVKSRTRVTVTSRGALIAATAKKYIGTAYRYGGSSPSGFDCSGFTRYVFKKAGIANLPRASSAQRHVGDTVPRSKAKIGDLIWTRGHVAIYLGGNKQIDAPRPGKSVQVRTIWQKNPTFIRV